MPHGVVHFEIPATDPDKISDFYRQLFDWHIEKMEGGGFQYWFVMTGPIDDEGMPKEPGFINGGLYPRQDANQTPVNYVDVEDVDAYAEKAKGLGATIIAPRMPVAGMGWFALLTDPDGNPFGIWQNDTGAA